MGVTEVVPGVDVFISIDSKRVFKKVLETKLEYVLCQSKALYM